MTIDQLAKKVKTFEGQLATYTQTPPQMDLTDLRKILKEVFREEEKIQAMDSVRTIELVSSTIIILLLIGIIFLMFFTEPI